VQCPDCPACKSGLGQRDGYGNSKRAGVCGFLQARRPSREVRRERPKPWPPPSIRVAEALAGLGCGKRAGSEPRSSIIAEPVMSTLLDQIVVKTRRNVDARKRGTDPREMQRRAERHVPRGFRRALLDKSRAGIAVIAELKKASPSKGLIRAEFCVEELARELEAAGAAALSVLTDEEFFQGSLENLRKASAMVRVPCLRKDFIVDEFQVLEARANSADAVLLIVAALTQEELIALGRSARSQGLDVLCEVHDEEQLQRAVDAECDLIGVNTRDLRTFKVDAETAFRLAERVPENGVKVAESGIRSGEDIARLRAAGYQAFLIGETLMRADSPGEALRELVTSSDRVSSRR
jgi:indole-3-glycerol phosphate synthase